MKEISEIDEQFLSAGRTETTTQDAFVVSVTQCLQDEGFEVIRAQRSSEQPLKPIWRKMQECAGTAVIAFERMHFAEGLEFRGSPKQKPLEDVSVQRLLRRLPLCFLPDWRSDIGPNHADDDAVNPLQ
jgi:hypothetical protein